MTKSPGSLESAVVRSSVMPSLKYSCSRSPLRLVKGSTTIEGLSGNGRAGLCAAGIDAEVAGGFKERCCTNTITAAMSASPASENTPPRQCFRRDRSFALAVVRVALAVPPSSITRNTRTGSVMFFDLLRAEVLVAECQLAPNFIVHLSGDADAARLG